MLVIKSPFTSVINVVNINIVLTQHLKRAFSVMDKSINVKAENKKYTILGQQSIAHHNTESNHRKPDRTSYT